MKKFLSMLLVCAMIFCMAPAMAIFADEAELTEYNEIDSVDEYLNFIAAMNAIPDGDDHGSVVPNGSTVKINCDLDFTGKEYTPLSRVSAVTIDFQGHTVSGINLNSGNNSQVALIVSWLGNFAGNRGAIVNLVLKDCTLTTHARKVGAVVGNCDRGYVDNITVENVTINTTAAQSAAVGIVVGHFDYANSEKNISLSAKNVTMNLTDPTNVGILVGTIANDAVIAPTSVAVSGLTVNGIDGFTADVDHLVGSAAAETSVELADGFAVTEVPEDETPNPDEGEGEGGETPNPGEGEGEGGETPNPGEGEGEGTETPNPGEGEGEGNNPGTGDATVFAVVLAVIALAGVAVVSKKRSAC